MNFGNVGFTEVIMIISAVARLLIWLVPLIVAIWAMMTLTRMRRLLDEIVARLDALAGRQTGLR